METTIGEHDVTAVLREARAGNPEAAESLFLLVYDHLRRVAQRLLAGERREHTLQPTALVHEAYLRLIDLRQVDWRDRAHFVAAATGAMRRVLVEHARRRDAAKRKAGETRVTLSEGVLGTRDDLGVLEIDMLLERLSELDKRRGEVVAFRIFGGLKPVEIAEVLGVSRRTVERQWRVGRAWLITELRSERLG